MGDGMVDALGSLEVFGELSEQIGEVVGVGAGRVHLQARLQRCLVVHSPVAARRFHRSSLRPNLGHLQDRPHEHATNLERMRSGELFRKPNRYGIVLFWALLSKPKSGLGPRYRRQTLPKPAKTMDYD